MFKKFCYYYLFIKKKGSCRHDVGVDVAQKCAEVGHHYALLKKIFNFVLTSI